MVITQIKVDNRRDKKFPIARGGAVSFAISSGITMTKVVNDINGQLLGYVYTIPNLTTDTTWGIEWLDKDGAILYTKSDLADNKPTTPFAVFLSSTELIYLYGFHSMRVFYTTSQTATIVVSPIYR